MYKVERKNGGIWVVVMGGFRSEMAAKFWLWDQDWFADPANEYRIVL